MSEEQAKPSPPQPKLWTPKFDARFPNTNQTKNCWQNYVDYHSCVNAGGENCEYYKKVFTSLCPTEWVSNWDDQREAGAFPGLP